MQRSLLLLSAINPIQSHHHHHRRIHGVPHTQAQTQAALQPQPNNAFLHPSPELFSRNNHRTTKHALTPHERVQEAKYSAQQSEYLRQIEHYRSNIAVLQDKVTIQEINIQALRYPEQRNNANTLLQAENKKMNVDRKKLQDSSAAYHNGFGGFILTVMVLMMF